MNPWELNPVLTQDRLVTLARAAVATRNRAFAEADRAAGDTNWGLACKAHERLMHTLGGLADGGEHPWLTVIRDGLYLMPRVEDVPIRVFRGTAARPGARHLDALRLEHARSALLEDTRPARPQMAFDFLGGRGGEGDEGGPWYWLMAMETGDAGLVSRVVLFQANDAGETRYPWECPFAVEERAAASVVVGEAPAPAAVIEAIRAVEELALEVVTAAEPPAPAAPAPVAPARGGAEGGRGRRARPARPVPMQAELWGTAAG